MKKEKLIKAIESMDEDTLNKISEVLQGVCKDTVELNTLEDCKRFRGRYKYFLSSFNQNVTDAHTDLKHTGIHYKTENESLRARIHCELQTVADALHKREFGIDRYEFVKNDINFYLRLEYNNNIFYTYTVFYPMTVYFKSKELAERAIEILGENKINFYLEITDKL